MTRLLKQKLELSARLPSFAASRDAFVKPVRDHKPVKPDLEDGYRSLAIVAAAEKSLETGAFVELAQFSAVVTHS